MAKARGKTRARRSTRALRLLVVGVLVFAGFLYFQPLTNYLHRTDPLAEMNAEVEQLRARKRALERRLAASRSPEALAREARRLGLIKEGERLFIVKGVEAWKRAHAATIDGGDR